MRVIESMSRWQWKWGYRVLTVRVWRNEARVKDSYNNEDIALLITLRSTKRSANIENPLEAPPISAFAEEISKLPRVNAVEILDESGNGILIYPNWP